MAIGIAVGLGICIARQQTTLQQNIELEEKRLEYLASDVTSLMDRMEQLTVQLSTLTSVGRAMSLDREMTIAEKMALNDEVEYLLGSSQYIDSVHLIFDRSATVYTSDHGMYDLFQYTYVDLYADYVLSSDESMIWMIASDYDDNNRLIRRLPIVSSYYSGTVIFNLSSDFFDNAISNMQIESDNAFVATYDEGLLYQSDDTAQTLYQLSAEATENIVAVEQSTYHVVEVSVDFYPMSFYGFVEVPWLFNNITAVGVLQFCLLWLICGFAVLFVLFAWVLRPLFAITNYIRSVDRLSHLEQTNSDYRLIHNALDGLVQENQAMVSMLTENRLALQEQLLNNLFHGALTEEQALQDELKLLELSFTHPYYYAIIVQFINLDEIHNYHLRTQLRLSVNKAIQLSFNQKLQEDSIAHSMLSGDNRIAIMYNTKTPVEENQTLQELCRDFQKKIYQELSVSIVFLFGSLEEELAYTYRSYAYANQLRDYSFEQHPEPYLFYSKDLVGAIYNRNLHRNMVQLLLAHQFTQIPSHCRDDLGKLYQGGQKWERTQQLSLLYCINIYMDLIEQELDVPALLLYTTIEKIQQIQRRNQLEPALLQYLQELTQVLAKQGDECDDKQDRINAVLQYIDQHYAEDLTVAQIAQSVHLNSIYLNRLMKLRTGNTLSDCLHIRRIAQAKYMLANTTRTINEIALDVGYYEARNFSRFFKKYEGKTPTEFREML